MKTKKEIYVNKVFYGRFVYLLNIAVWSKYILFPKSVT